VVLFRWFFIWLLLVPCLGYSQTTWKPKDSIQLSMKNRPNFRLGLDGRQSFISGHPVTIWGLRYGLDYGKVAFYTGWYGTDLGGVFADKDTFFSQYRYQSSTLEYSLYKTWRWQLESSFQLGLGIETEVVKRRDGIVTNKQKLLMPLEGGMSCRVRLLRYIGLSLGLGIRYSPINGQGFNGSFGSGGLTFYSGTLLKDTKKLFKKLKGDD